MVDFLKAILDYLTGNAALAALTGDGERIYASPYLPQGYDLEDGAAILFHVRGGENDYTGRVLSPSITFECYDATEVAAWDCYRALHDALDDAKAGVIAMCRLDMFGQYLPDEDTDFPRVVGAYRFWIVND